MLPRVLFSMGGVSQEGGVAPVTGDGGCVPPVLSASCSLLDGSVAAPGPAERG